MTVTNQEIYDKVVGISASVIVLESVVAKLSKSIDGNGQKGLLQRAGYLEDFMENHLQLHKKNEEDESDAEKERRAFWRSVALAVIGLILSNIGTLLVLLLKEIL